jgi:CYTH domain-containing protein
VPDGAVPAAEILDRYIDGTTLRLRRMQSGPAVVHKLAQKIRVVADDPELVKITNIYLNPTEYAILAAVPAAELTKTRWRLVIGGRQYTIDQFHGRLEGLHLVETTLEPDDPTVEAPEFTTVDVTHEDRYAGGSLATASDPDVTEILTRRGV